MKHKNDSFDATLRRHGRLHLPSPAQLDASRERIRERLARALPSVVKDAPDGTRTRRAHTRRFGFAVASVATVVALCVAAPWNAPALATVADGELYVGADRHLLQSGRAINAGEIVRLNGGHGSVVELSDGSRVEMRTRSELVLERADDGVRIRLTSGGIIVNAASQRTGHLYVQTKDVTVSVVGTVFMVDAAASGSRVAVIEGSVRVQQGTSERQLLPGEQVTTNPMMEAPPVSREISWSRNAETLRARLQESTRPVAIQQPVRATEVFEEASVRLSGQTVVGGGRGGASRSPCSELFLDTARDGSPIFRVQLDPRRFAVTRTTLWYTLIAWAHGRDCGALNLGGLVTGGPGWLGSDEWDIQALIPEGAAGYTVRQFVDGHAPELQARLRNLLAQRFQLVIRAEKKDVSGYVLTRGEGPLKLKPRLEPTGPGLLTGGKDEFGSQYLIFMNVPESNVARMLMLATGRMVLDRTGIKDGFYLDLEFARPSGGGSSRPSLFKALEEVGLRLEEATLPEETLFIERVERPTENRVGWRIERFRGGRRLPVEEQMTPATALQQPTVSLGQDFDEIYRDHAPLVYRTAWGVLGSREDAEDVVQTVFLRLLQRESPVEIRKNPGSYLDKAAVNAALDILKARRRRPVLVEHLEQLDIAAPTFDSHRLEELHQRLYAALDRLSPEARGILILRYMHKKSVAEIGETLGVSRAAVSLRLFRSRARMRTLLRDVLGDQS